MSAVEQKTNLQGVMIRGALGPRADEILNDRSLAFLAALHRKFDPSRLRLLPRRDERQARLDAGTLPDFLAETADVRSGNWKVAPIPADLLDRRVEITGPTDRKMVINALMTILRSVGPVISTRRSRRSAGIGATFQLPLRTSAVSARKSGSVPASR